MELTEILTVINSVGFPIAVCLICFWYINKKDGQHQTEMEKITQAINNNTQVMRSFIDKFREG